MPIDTIEGIGPVYAAKLKEIGILFVSDLLDAGASRKGREELVEKTGISAALVLKWVNMADLMRISGVGEEYSELLEAAGVDTVKELRNRNPENLYQAMLQANRAAQDGAPDAAPLRSAVLGGAGQTARSGHDLLAQRLFIKSVRATSDQKIGF